MLKSVEVNRAVVAPIIVDAMRAQTELKSLSVRKIAREQNNVAHELAQRARRLGESRVWFGTSQGAWSLFRVKTWFK